MCMIYGGQNSMSLVSSQQGCRQTYHTIYRLPITFLFTNYSESNTLHSHPLIAEVNRRLQYSLIYRITVIITHSLITSINLPGRSTA